MTHLDQWWRIWLYTIMIVASVTALVCTIGGVVDLVHFFRDLTRADIADTEKFKSVEAK